MAAPSRILPPLLAAVVGLGVGLWIPRSAPPPPPPVPAPAPIPPPLQCVQTEAPDAAPAEAATRLEICERILDAQARPAPQVELVFGAPSPSEGAAVWTAAVDGALQRCGRTGLEVAECSRYPCVGLVPDAPPDTGVLALDDCLAEALGAAGLPEVLVLPVALDCGSGQVAEVTVLTAIDPGSEAALSLESGGSMDSMMGAWIHFGGRVQAAASLWPCPEAGAGAR